MADVSKIRYNDKDYDIKDALTRDPVDAELARIRDEGSTQVSEIDQKGQEVLDSIPEEYEELSGNVESLAGKHEYLANTSQVLLFQADEITGTKYKSVPVSLPAGKYILETTDAVSSDTDYDYCSIAFGSNMDNRMAIQRGEPTEIEFELLAATKTMYVYASDGASASSGDTFTVSGLTITKSLTDDTLTKKNVPADAKTVGDVLGKSRVTNTISQTWTNKTINGTSGKESASETRICTIEFTKSNGDTYIVTAAEGYKYSFRYYTSNESSSIFGTTDWMTGEHTVPVEKDQYFKVVCSNSTDTAIDASEGVNVEITGNSYTDKTLTQQDKPADALAVGERFEAVEANTGNNIVARNNPAETVLKLDQLTQKPRTGGSTYGTKPLCLLHFSDLHNDEARLRNIMDFVNHYADYLDDVINTGDTVYYRSTDGISAWTNVSGAEKVLITVGNHDTRVGNTWIGQTEAESYAMYIAPFAANWDAEINENHCYYYKDYRDEHVRLIVLDIMHQTQEQLAWFTAALASAIEDDLHVLAAVHSRAHWDYDAFPIPWDDKPVVSGYAAGYTDKSGTTYPENLSDDYAGAVDTFMGNGGYFIAWIHGHTHFKMFAKLHTHPNQLDISVANAGIGSFARTYVNARVEGSKSEDSFNVLAIDTTSKILRMMAVGATYDRYMRHTDTVSYSYETHELLYSN